jgi:hypothetical protein
MAGALTITDPTRAAALIDHAEILIHDPQLQDLNATALVSLAEVLSSRDAAARGALDQAFAASCGTAQDAVRSLMQTSHADRAAARLVYPVPLAFVETLVGLAPGRTCPITARCR